MHSLYKNQLISILENLSFGSHICFFYQKKEELIEILISYFKEGLKNNEYCIWINSEPLQTSQIEIKLKESLYQLSDDKKKVPFEVVPFKDWYFNNNKFNFHYAFNKWSDKVNTVLDLGFNGLRMANNISLLNINYWEDFRQYEGSVNDVITLCKSIILCTYSLRNFNLFEILDSIDDHQYSIINHNNSWSVVKSSSEFDFKEKLTINENTYKSVNNIFRSTSSKQKKLEQQIKDYKDFLSNLFSSIQDGICIIDTHLNITFVNPKMEEWYPKKKPLQGKKCYEVFYERSEPCEDCKCSTVIKSGEMCCILNYEKTYEGKNARYFNVYNYPFYDAETHEINGIIKYFRDETKFATTRKRLKESEENYRRIFDKSPLGIDIASIDGIVIAMNKKMEELTGYNMKELNDLGLENIYVDPNKRNEIVENIRTQGFIRDYEVKKKRKDGTSYLALLDVDLIEIEGEPLLHTTERDITYQKLAEKKLKESEQKFRSFVESTPVATFLYQHYICIYANLAAIKLTEYSLEELYMLKFWDFVHPDYRNLVHPDLRNLERNVPCKSVNEFKIITKNGVEKWINGNMVSIEYEGKQAALISAIDITEKKEAETELLKLNKIKSSLLRRTSHELKTPLVSIKGNANLLLELYLHELSYDTITIIEDLRKGCERLEILIGGILETLRLEANQITLKTSFEDLTFLIQFCVREMKDEIKERKHKIYLEVQNNLITKFEKERIFDVLTNLLSNAIKYTPPNGIITIKSEIKDDFYIISIQDNGIGFNNEEKEGIFEQFGKIERYGRGLDVLSEGTGLGLYISKKIVELHGGNMWMESEGEFKGSTFYFSLPIVKE